MAELIDIRESVRKRYADAASAVARRSYEDARALEAESGCCGAGAAACSPADETGVFGADLYDETSRYEVPDAAISASLGCGVPTAVADLRDGETVLDLGSGAGADVLISARRFAPTGKAIGLDMTDEMLELARANDHEAGVTNVEFIKGYLEDMPFPDASVDVVISNCVINLSGDEPKTIAEAAGVPRPGDRFAISDVIAAPDMEEPTEADHGLAARSEHDLHPRERPRGHQLVHERRVVGIRRELDHRADTRLHRRRTASRST